MSMDVATELMQVARRLLTKDARPIREWLQEIARASGALGAGMSAPADGNVFLEQAAWVGEPIAPPWNNEHELQEALHLQPDGATWPPHPQPLSPTGARGDAPIDPPHSPTGAMGDALVPHSAAAFLAVRIADAHVGNWILWVAGDVAHWTDEQKAALALTGLAVGQWAFHGESSWRVIAARVSQQRAMEHAAQVTGRLAHDFGNILTGILGFSELAAQRLAPRTAERRYLQEVLDGAVFGTQWVRKLQVIGRRHPPSRMATAPIAILEREIARAKKTWGKAVSFQVFADNAPAVHVDVDSLRQAIGEVLDNACEAVGDSGMVAVSVRATELNATECAELLGSASPGSFVEIAIADSGPGLPPEWKDRLWHEPFLSNKPRHRGMGLAQVFGLVRAFGGGLRLTSQPNQGASAWLYFPQAPAALGLEPPLETVRAPRSCPEGRLLVVDDDPMVLDMLRRTLEKAGFEVKAAAGAHEALNLVDGGERFRLVITDVCMPEMTGLELARRLLQHGSPPRLLFMSGLPQSSETGWDQALQRFTFLSKPFEPTALMQAVQHALAVCA
ncbi:MAG: response regulator [Gemmataceae bacterium]|nr:response regulator [Gemmataceae bacterium]